jgi:hypothetical protein
VLASRKADPGAVGKDESPAHGIRCECKCTVEQMHRGNPIAAERLSPCEGALRIKTRRYRLARPRDAFEQLFRAIPQFPKLDFAHERRERLGNTYDENAVHILFERQRKRVEQMGRLPFKIIDKSINPRAKLRVPNALLRYLRECLCKVPADIQGRTVDEGNKRARVRDFRFGPLRSGR